MKTIRKTPKKATYFEGTFALRDNSKTNWGTPIDFPTVFVAYGQAIRSGNWQSCTGINTPQYVIDHFFNGRKGAMSLFWEAVFTLENITWQDVEKDKGNVLILINNANNQLLKLPSL